MLEDEALGDVRGADRTAEMPQPPEPTGAHPTEPLTQQHPTSEPEVKAIEDRIDDRIKKSERLMILFTAVIALFTIGLVIVGVLQWSAMRGQLAEMRSGSADTHGLAEAAEKQSSAAIQQMGYSAALAASAYAQSERTKDLANRMKEQADRTKVIADQAVIQARAAQVSADAAKAAAKTASDSLDVTQRPWITEIAQIGGPILFSVNGLTVAFLFTIDNVGHSPASNVWINGRLINSMHDGMPPLTAYRRFCEGAPTSMMLGETVFPGGHPMQTQWTFTIPWDEINGTQAPSIVAPILYGCVAYRYGLSNTQHFTPFRYDVFQSDRRVLVHDGGFTPTTGEIPIQMLRLQRGAITGQPAPN